MTAHSILTELSALPLPKGCLQVEYIWIDGYKKLRSKGRTILDKEITKPDDLPHWNYDGSSTGQAPGDRSEVILKPAAIYPDPFRGKPNLLVMCDTYMPGPDGDEPLPTNSRFACNVVMEKAKDLEVWTGLEQEYFLMNPKTNKPVGFPADGEPSEQGPYYCGVGPENVFGRDVVEAHYRACLYAGIKISGINGEVAPGQWEFQIGPATGIEQGDMMWTARYILERCAELAGWIVNIDPKPVKGDWNGTGLHSNFSTRPMREEGGYKKYILPAMKKLERKHAEHIAAYGEGNEQRLTGKHETANIDTFRYGVADRGASIRIGSDIEEAGKGYFEDRRPAGNGDPYVITRLLVQTCCDISGP